MARYRAAYPVLRRLPLESVRDNALFSPALQRCIPVLETRATEVLDRLGIINSDLMGITEDEDAAVPEVDVIWRQDARTHSSMIPTLLMVAEWKIDSETTWPIALNEIIGFMNLYLRECMCYEKVHVELISFEMTAPKYLGCPPSIPGLLEAWPNLQEQILSMLNRIPETKNFVTAIGLFTLGFNPTPDLNPTTVYISLDDPSDETAWGSISDSVKSFLYVRGWGMLDVHMEHNKVERHPFHLVQPRGTAERIQERIRENNLLIEGPYQQAVNLGDDLGAAKYVQATDGSYHNSVIGTLGCYVEVRCKGSSDWKKLALTNYHVVRSCFDGMSLNTRSSTPVPGAQPGQTLSQSKANATTISIGAPATNTELSRVDRIGFKFSEHSQKSVESPTRCRHNHTIWDIDFDLQDEREQITDPHNERDRIQRLTALLDQRREKVAFFDEGKNILGHVFYASGYRRRSQGKGRLDWALISVDQHRQGQNRLPTQAAWRHKYKVPGSHLPKESYGALLKQPTQSLRAMNLGDHVWKQGAITGVTHGVYNEFKTNCIIKEDGHLNDVSRTSSEYCIIGGSGLRHGTDARFSGHRDSGAVVFDHAGHLVGLVFGGQVPHQDKKGYTLVTPIEDIFDDIKAISNGEIEDIRVAV